MQRFAFGFVQWRALVVAVPCIRCLANGAAACAAARRSIAYAMPRRGRHLLERIFWQRLLDSRHCCLPRSVHFTTGRQRAVGQLTNSHRTEQTQARSEMRNVVVHR